MIFYKTVTFGNDFIHINLDEYLGKISHEFPKNILVQRLCDRHTGAGADGVIFYKQENHKKEIQFEIFNQDGGEAELSGNGMAGLSALLFYLKQIQGQEIILDTKVGLKRHCFLNREKNQFLIKVEIGLPDFRNKTFFPFLEKNKTVYQYKDYSFYPVSVGNPHVVTILNHEATPEELEKIGETLGEAEIFPFKTNVEIVLPEVTKNTIEKKKPTHRVFYFERGVGPTLSSSTGSAAAFAVLRLLNIVKDTLIIPCPLGEIKISGEKKIYIENCSEIVYKGIYIYTNY